MIKMSNQEMNYQARALMKVILYNLLGMNSNFQVVIKLIKMYFLLNLLQFWIHKFKCLIINKLRLSLLKM